MSFLYPLKTPENMRKCDFNKLLQSHFRTFLTSSGCIEIENWAKMGKKLLMCISVEFCKKILNLPLDVN